MKFLKYFLFSLFPAAVFAIYFVNLGFNFCPTEVQQGWVHFNPSDPEPKTSNCMNSAYFLMVLAVVITLSTIFIYTKNPKHILFANLIALGLLILGVTFSLSML